MVFGEPPRIQLDLVFELSDEASTPQEFEYPNLQILFDHKDELNPKIDPLVKNYCVSKKEQLKNIYSKAREIGDLVMIKAKIRHDTKI